MPSPIETIDRIMAVTYATTLETLMLA